MKTIMKLKNYWIGMLISPFILVITAAMDNNDLDELFTTDYLFNRQMGLLIGGVILAILASYIYHIVKEGIIRDIQDVRKYIQEKGGVAQ